MPATCIVVGCGNRSEREKLSFFSVPTPWDSKYLHTKNELSRKRRELWLAAIDRDDLTTEKIKNLRVCSEHFISGKPASLENVNDPDWVPSQNMGHISQNVIDRGECMEKKGIPDKRRKVEEILEGYDVKTNSEPETSVSAITSPYFVADIEVEAAACANVQTDITMEELDLKFHQLQFAAKKIADLEKKITNFPYGLMDDISNDDKWKYYTGFKYDIISLVIFDQVYKDIPHTSTTALSSFNQFLLTMIKLRLGVHFKDLAFHFKISPTTTSTYFENIIDILYKKFRSLILWPVDSIAEKNIPKCFKESFNSRTIIIDCFEVFIEKPASLLTQQQCWSNYKHHNTVKFLIGIIPQGSICFISQAWGGRASDRQIVEGSGFLNFIRPGDIVLADRGFLIKELLGVRQAKVVIPAFTKGKNQLHPIEIEETREIAQVRIHIERIIGTLKNKFNILKGTIPISMLKKGSYTNVNLLDKIVTICSVFVNLSPEIIPI